MAQKARQVKLSQKSAAAEMHALEQRSNEELERETKYKSAAMSILGARAASKYDAAASREYFRRAIAAARPQERMQIRRMADASLALAERRPDDLKAAVERLGQEAPSSRQLLLLRFTGILSPPPGSSLLLKLRGLLAGILIVVGLLAIGFGIVTLISLPFGGLGLAPSFVAGALLVALVLGGLVLFGRRRQSRARAAAAG